MVSVAQFGGQVRQKLRGFSLLSLCGSILRRPERETRRFFGDEELIARCN